VQQLERWIRSARWCCASQGTAGPGLQPTLPGAAAAAALLMHLPAELLPTPTWHEHSLSVICDYSQMQGVSMRRPNL